MVIVPHDRWSSTPHSRRSGPFGNVIKYTTCMLAYLTSLVSIDRMTIASSINLHCYIPAMCSSSISFLGCLLVHCSCVLCILCMFLPTCFVPEFYERIIGNIKSGNCLWGERWDGWRHVGDDRFDVKGFGAKRCKSRYCIYQLSVGSSEVNTSAVLFTLAPASDSLQSLCLCNHLQKLMIQLCVCWVTNTDKLIMWSIGQELLRRGCWLYMYEILVSEKTWHHEYYKHTWNDWSRPKSHNEGPEKCVEA